MKKIIALFILAATLLTMVSCGAINKSEVSILWGDQSDKSSFDLANALDRTMYSQNIKYAHYDAKGDAKKQIDQAKGAVEAGACALVVSPTDAITAMAILKIAKDADIPIIFLCDGTLLSLAEDYDKCYYVSSDTANVFKLYSKSIAMDILANYEDYDRDENGEISYVAFGTSLALVDDINAELAALKAKDLEKSKLFQKYKKVDDPKIVVSEKQILANPLAVTESIDLIFNDYDGSGNKVNATPTEIILTDSESYIVDMLLALRKYELNYKKLVTHSLPIYTFGYSSNASVLEYGEIDAEKFEKLSKADLALLEEGKLSDEAIEAYGKALENDKEYLKSFKKKYRESFVDALESECAKRDAYTVASVIDAGYVTAAAREYEDGIAEVVSLILKNHIKGNDIFKNIEENSIDGNKVYIPYTIHGID